MTAAAQVATPTALTLREAAAELKIGLSTIYRLVGTGELATYQHAGKSWVTQAAIDDYFQRRAAAGQDAAAQRRAAARKRPKPVRVRKSQQTT